MSNTETRRLGVASMIRLDLYRLIHTPALYIMLAISAMIPAMILSMSGEGSGSSAPAAAYMNTWQVVESLGGSAAGANPLDMGSYGNINMVYIFAGLLMAIFIAHDYSSGFVKNIFAVHARKRDYAISKLFIGTIGGWGMLATYILGSCISGVLMGLSFDVDLAGLALCIFSKALLMFAFCGLFACIAVLFRHNLWVTIVFTFLFGMMLYPAASIANLASTPAIALATLVAGAVGGAAFTAIAVAILGRRDLV